MWEKEINLAVALQVEKALTARGASVTLTRREDIALCDETTASGSKSARTWSAGWPLGEEIGADMVLSIHMNEYRDRSQSGPQVFYRQESDESRLLAGCMQAALISALSPPKERAALAGDYFILRLPVPSVLIECGFISNSAEEKLLLDSAYQARLGEAIARGLWIICPWKPGGAQPPAEILRPGGGKRHTFSRARVRKGQGISVEHQPPHRYSMAGAVQWVPRHGMMNGLHMHADLMGTPVRMRTSSSVAARPRASTRQRVRASRPCGSTAIFLRSVLLRPKGRATSPASSFMTPSTRAR